MRVRSFLARSPLTRGVSGIVASCLPTLALAQAAESLPTESLPAELAAPAAGAAPAVVGHNLDLFNLILHASLPVQIVMGLLVLGSIASWMIIFRKKSVLDAARSSADTFEERFWSGADLAALFRDATEKDREISGIEAIFEAGFREFARLRQKRGVDARTQLEGAQRAMRAELAREVDGLEHNLEFLANVGSISPYVGLFGTVWGIMISFQGLANVKEATIATVAPGISEALIATAMGLFAAIPAVWAYNRYSTRVDRLNVRYEAFAEEFSSILQRQAHIDD
ncbi:MAG: protein TolQ [Xanthomonadales bacterium]|nr:protein TolQ [Xanthomonadales bacterium]